VVKKLLLFCGCNFTISRGGQIENRTDLGLLIACWCRGDNNRLTTGRSTAMTLRRLEVFLAVAQHLNITRVSRDLHVSQPAISQEIKRLESSLGVTLILRQRRGIELTEAGRSLKSDVEKILGNLNAIKTKWRPLLIAVFVGLAASANLACVYRQRQRIRHRFRPGVAITSTANRDQRGDRGQRLQHFRLTDVAGVDSQLGAFQRRESLRPQQAVRVGNQTDPSASQSQALVSRRKHGSDLT
jgi:DNA-binding transcriptional ArsR family regulator